MLVRVCAVPETGSSHAYSGRAPRAVKLTHCVVPLRQADDAVSWPGARGPTARDFEAIPVTLVVEDGEPRVVTLSPAFHETV